MNRIRSLVASARHGSYIQRRAHYSPARGRPPGLRRRAPDASPVGSSARYRRGRFAAPGVWAAALGAYAMAAGALAWGAAAGWSAPAFRLYYLGGALLSAALLGAGSLLLAGRRWAVPLALLYTGLAVGVALAVPLEGGISGSDLPEAQEVLEPLARARACHRGELARDARGRRRGAPLLPPQAARERADPRRRRRRGARERPRRPRRGRAGSGARRGGGPPVRGDPGAYESCSSSSLSARLDPRARLRLRPALAEPDRGEDARRRPAATRSSTTAPARLRGRSALREQPQPAHRVEDHQREHGVLGPERRGAGPRTGRRPGRGQRRARRRGPR